MSRKSLFILSVLAAASFNAAACYTVFDRSNRVAYQGERTPVDMSLPLHKGLQSRFPGGHMVFDQSATCSPVGLMQVSRAPLPDAPPNTAIMGAGPANGKVVRSVVVPARASARTGNNGTVITEMHNPPMTVVHTSNNTLVSPRY